MHIGIIQVYFQSVSTSRDTIDLSINNEGEGTAKSVQVWRKPRR